MIALLKRYSVAIGFLLLMALLMILGTWGVTLFGEKMFEDSGVQIHPRGENLNK